MTADPRSGVPPSEARRLHERTLVVDGHAHPVLKTYLFRRKLGVRNRTGRTFNPFALRVDLPKLIEGGVNVLVSSVYLPELGLLNDCVPLRLVTLFPRMRRLTKGDRFTRTIELIDDFERTVRGTPPIEGTRLEVATSLVDLEDVLASGNIAVLHSIEGAHSLAGSLDNLELLFARGVCLITLAHFYPNEAVWPVDGIPPPYKKLGCFRQTKDLSRGLTPFGCELVEAMVDLGVIVDMTHATPVARREILDVARGRRPIAMTHVGVWPDPMNPNDAEIRRIADTGGIVGVIFMDYWLSGESVANGLDPVVETMRHLRDVGGIDCVAFGSDFDGFTDPPDELSDHAALPRLTEGLLAGGFSQGDVEKVLGGNFRRVLEAGWGRAGGETA